MDNPTKMDDLGAPLTPTLGNLQLTLKSFMIEGWVEGVRLHVGLAGSLVQGCYEESETQQNHVEQVACRLLQCVASKPSVRHHVCSYCTWSQVPNDRLPDW